MISSRKIIDLTRSKSRSVPPEPELLPPCRVCGGKASGLHYGANTCHGCKGFFRRSMFRDEEYLCIAGDSQCASLRKPTIKACPLCRHQRCLEVGMSKTAIRSGRYTYTMRAKNLQEARGLDNSELSYASTTAITPAVANPRNQRLMRHTPKLSLNSSSLDLCESELGFRSDSLPNINRGPESKSLPSSSDNGRLSIEASLGTNEELKFERVISNITDSHRKFSDNIHLLENAKELQAQQERFYELTKLREGMFGELRPISRAEYRDFYLATGIDIDDRHSRARALMKDIEEHIFTQVQFAKNITGFKDLRLEDQWSFFELCLFDYHGSYNADLNIKVLPGGMAVRPHELCYFDNNELMAERTKFEKSLNCLELNCTETALIKAIILLFSDRIPLDVPADVDKLQLTVVNAFRHYLRKTHPNSKKRFATIWNKIIQARTFSLQHEEVRRSCVMDFPEMKDFPLFYEAWKE